MLVFSVHSCGHVHILSRYTVCEELDILAVCVLYNLFYQILFQLCQQNGKKNYIMLFHFSVELVIMEKSLPMITREGSLSHVMETFLFLFSITYELS